MARGPGTGFGRRLRELREARGWSQEALAEKCNLAVQTLSRFERDLRVPDWATALTLCLVLGATPDDFTSDAEKRAIERRRAQDQLMRATDDLPVAEIRKLVAEARAMRGRVKR